MKEKINNMNKYAIWKDHKVIDYIELTNQQRQTINSIPDLGIYIGYDAATNPELYPGNSECKLRIFRMLEDYNKEVSEKIAKVISGNEDTLPNLAHYYNDGCLWFVSMYGFFHIIGVSPIQFNNEEDCKYVVKIFLVNTDGKLSQRAIILDLPGSSENGFFDTKDAALLAMRGLDGQFINSGGYYGV